MEEHDYLPNGMLNGILDALRVAIPRYVVRLDDDPVGVAARLREMAAEAPEVTG